MSSNFTKVVHVGTVDAGLDAPVSLFCSIKFNDGRLSITGVEGPMRSGNCRGGCGQVVMHEWFFHTYAPGWDAAKVARFREVWDRWHLNDMQAGSPAQSTYLREHPVTDRLHYFEAACTALRGAGLHPDPSHMHNGKPYLYGSAWLREEVPADVLDFLSSLPDADKTPAWV